jgi:hypothetical protein
MHQVGAHYELGFILGQLALNTRHSDPHRLNRLLVNPAWSRRSLSANWKPSGGRARTGREPRFVRRRALDRRVGRGRHARQRMALRAIPPQNPVMTLRQSPVSATTGAKAWLAGSDTLKTASLPCASS